ncbi:MAG: prolipoprotein diacylglyceryl transferase [Actinomycetota bacterium]|nr:prolipoprotein diacylglyceryl transferase [Actinomycetota bacterium]
MIAAISWPILERIPIVGDLAISPHGIGIAAGFLLGAVLMVRRARLRGIADFHVPDVREAVESLLTRAAVGAIVGARFFYVINHLDQFAADPLAVLAVWRGGLTLLGGITGALIAALPAARSRGYRPALLLDSAAIGLAAGLAVGRLGDLAIGDHIGGPAPGFPLAWRCTGNYWQASTNSIGYTPPQPYPVGAPAQPVQGCFDVAVMQTALNDMLVAAIILVLLLVLERGRRWDGFFIAVFIYGYGIGRLALDFLREDRRLVAGLTGSQWAALAAVIAVTTFLAWRKPWRQRPWAWQPPDFPHSPQRRAEQGKRDPETAGRTTAP